MGKAKIFLAFASIIAILLATSHVLHFVSPFLELSQEVESGDTTWVGIPDDPDDFTANDLMQIVFIMNTYEWENYNANDFPDWMYMSTTYPSSLNASEGESVPVFMGYHWNSYDPDDFPEWMDPPATLPADFNSSDPEDVNDFTINYMDPDMRNDLAELMSQYEENPVIFGTTMATTDSLFSVLSIPFISFMELIYAIIFLAGAIVLFIISRSVS